MIHRMILQSHPGVLDLLPALPEAWPKGEIRGLLARRQITINRLAWDKSVGTVALKLTSGIQQTISLRLGEKRQELALMKEPSSQVRPVALRMIGVEADRSAQPAHGLRATTDEREHLPQSGETAIIIWIELDRTL